MKQFFSEFKFIILFFVLLTGVTVYSFVESETHHPVHTTSNLETIYSKNTASVQQNEAPSRQLASVERFPENQQTVLAKTFLCAEKSKATSAQHIRDHMVMINFDLCQRQLHQSAKELHLENQSNGFKAQIFKVEGGSYKTDFIQLNPGLNKLKLEVVLKDGQKLVESLEILSGS